MLGRQRQYKRVRQDAELDITSFMNLMIVLVPVLLMMMVFSRITVVELALPGLSSGATQEDVEHQQLEVLVTREGMAVYFPQGYLVREIPLVTNEESNALEHDYALLQTTLKQVKQTLLAKELEKDDLVLLLEDDVSYQTIVSLIDTVRSYPDVVAASVVPAELFPNVSFADAPQHSVFGGKQ
ncbi:biopolymer transporter ExbD [Alteromonas facilis]|uniref:biopolymer transporter ExbD n=1 Tax=Alteromonas facilis TaxID=2048004 RepID=UPI000C28F429|nr:biopolymer transporter ExbD [Alteromonas facilis]